MPRLVIILLYSLLLLPACTIVDMGGAVDEIGKQVAVPQVKKRSEKWRKGAYDYAPTPAWKKGDTYYIQLPIAYVPAQYWYVLHYSPYLLNNGYEWPQRLTDEDISRYPTEIYYAVLNQEQFKEARRHPKIELPPRMRDMEYEIVPAAAVDLTGAEKLTDCATEMPQRILLDRLPARRTTGNQWRRPLVFVLDVADIPVSIVATPIGWVANVILCPFARK